jgi:hypothetical protein
MYKLEILKQFKKKYGSMINPDLISLKYCQSEEDAFIEMLFTNLSSPRIIYLDYISYEVNHPKISDYNSIPPLFKPETDIVDNATRLIELDPFCLTICMENLFTKTALQQINQLLQTKL